MYWASRRVKERRTLSFSEPTTSAATAALDVAAGKVSRLVGDYPDYFPLYTDHGRWKHGKESWTNWCEGFLGGQMWLFYELGLGEDWKTRAEHYGKPSSNVSTTIKSMILVSCCAQRGRNGGSLLATTAAARSSSRAAGQWLPGSIPRESSCDLFSPR